MQFHFFISTNSNKSIIETDKETETENDADSLVAFSNRRRKLMSMK